MPAVNRGQHPVPDVPPLRECSSSADKPPRKQRKKCSWLCMRRDLLGCDTEQNPQTQCTDFLQITRLIQDVHLRNVTTSQNFERKHSPGKICAKDLSRDQRRRNPGGKTAAAPAPRRQLVGSPGQALACLWPASLCPSSPKAARERPALGAAALAWSSHSVLSQDGPAAGVSGAGRQEEGWEPTETQQADG